MRKQGLKLLSMALLIVSCTQAVKESYSSEEVEAHRQSISEWDAKRYEFLKGPDGWVNLAGLFWLKEGINTFGSGKENDLVFPQGKIPERAGFILVKQGLITIESVEGVDLLLNGERTNKGLLYYPDSARVVAEHGPLKWFVLKRDDKFGIRLRDVENPALEKFHAIERYPVNIHWRINGKVEWADSSRTIMITNILGQTTPQRSVGTLVFKLSNKEYRLDALDEGGDEFFIIFGDETNARETYGAGRYMYVPMPEEGDEVIIDFNKAYNPPCAFTEFATCPLPPQQNILPIPIPAGEKNYDHH